MKIDKNIPFYSNTPDDTHCFQACLRMVLKYYFPKKKYSWDYLDKISAKVEGLWTWPMASLVWIKGEGIEVRRIGVFDYEKFIADGGDYLFEEYGKEVSEAQIKNSNIQQEIIITKEFIEKVKVEKRIPEIEDLVDLLKDDYLLICNINAKALNRREGYCGHSVLLKGVINKNFIINDPGGHPGHENRMVDFELFNKAWAYPNKRSKAIMAFKLS